MRPYLFSAIVLLFISSVFGQKMDSIHDVLHQKTGFKRSHFSLSVIPFVSQKTKVARESGNYSFTATALLGIEAGGNYHINFNHDYSLIVGLHGGVSGRGLSLFINKDDYNPQLRHDVNDKNNVTSAYDFYLGAPVWLEKRWQCKNGNYWNVLAGINVRYYPGNFSEGIKIGYPDVNGQGADVYHLNVAVGNNNKPWINYNLGGGYSFLLRNDNFLQVNLLANASNTKMVTGDYTILVTGKPQSTGTYSATLSYLGLAVDYVFSGTGRHIHHVHERQL